MKKVIMIVFLAFCLVSPSFAEIDVSDMTRIWCTMYYKHWAIGYSNSIGYRDVDFYLYLDEDNNKLYNERKKLIESANIGKKEIDYSVSYHASKKNYQEHIVIDRYSGKATVSGSIRHDYGAWASLTYENRDFEGFGQCASYDEEKKF